MKKPFIVVFLLSLLLFTVACQNDFQTSEKEVCFCSLFDAPLEYESKIIETKAIALGFHEFIFYSGQCLEENKVAALEMSYQSRRKIIEAVKANKITYKTSFLNSNLYAEIDVSGELKKNDEKLDADIFHPKYKFVIEEVRNVKTLSEEIFPSEKARGVREIK